MALQAEVRGKWRAFKMKKNGAYLYPEGEPEN